MRLRLYAVAGIVAAGAVSGGIALAAASPAVKTGGAAKITQESATLTGTVNPNGSSTTYYFQWGLTTGYGVSGSAHSAGSGSRDVSVRETASGLSPGTTYHYRLVATNGAGTSVGADRTFKTAGHPPPGVETGPATSLSANGATLTGAIDPAGQTTTYFFQWGTSPAYGQQTAPQSLPPGSAVQSVAASLQGLLAAGRIYHFRLVASHGAAATSYGADSSFMTYPSPRPVPRVSARTRPHHARRRPFVLTTTGVLHKPAFEPDQYVCHGNVTIRFFRGRRQVRFTLAAIEPNCTFAARTVFAHLTGPRARRHAPQMLRIVIRSLATPYLGPSRAPIEHVILG